MRRTALVLGLILVGITVGSVQAAIVADSVNEFSGTQGHNNWYYGYYDRTNDPNGIYDPASDFQLMTEFQNISTYFGSWIWSVNWANWGPGGYWTSLGALGGHPNGTNQNWGRLPAVQWPIRRWVSEVAGTITISGTFKGLDCGNITGYIIVDGVQVWSQNISCTAGVNYTVDAAVQVGSTVDFAITPGESDADVNDSTEFTAVISTESDTFPPSAATLWIGLKNSDDQGTQFDLRIEVDINDTPVAEGETRCITGVTRNPSKAKEVSVEFGPISDGVLTSGDVLSLKVLTRIGTNPDDTKCSGLGGSHNNAVGYGCIMMR
jgi:hypothetical protein